jgi:hypothetical protein
VSPVAKLADRCDGFFDAELGQRPSHGALLRDPGGSALPVDTEGPTQLSLSSLYLAGESLAPDRDYLVVVRIETDRARYAFLTPDAIRAAARETTAGTRIFDLPIGPWPGADARLSFLAYRVKRHRRSDRVLMALRELVMVTERVADTHGTSSLANTAFEIIELLRRSGDALLLVSGTLEVPLAAAGDERFAALMQHAFEPGSLSMHEQRLVISEDIDTPQPLVGSSHCVLRIGRKPAVTDVRRHIEKLRSQARVRRQLGDGTEGTSYLTYLQSEVKLRRDETIQALYGDLQQKLPVVTPVAIEAAANLAGIVAFEDDKDTPFKLGLEALRTDIHRDIGVRMPATRIRLNEDALPDGAYIIMINEVPLVSGNVDAGKLLCDAGVADLEKLGIEAVEMRIPSDGRNGAQVSIDHDEQLIEADIQFWDAGSYILLHLSSVVRKNASHFFGIDDLASEIRGDDNGGNEELLADLDAAKGGLVRFREAVVSLLDEHLTCRPIRLLAKRYLELNRSRPVYEIADELRLLPDINRYLLRDSAKWQVFPLAPDCVKVVMNSIQRDGDAVYVAMPPETTQEFLTAVRNEISAVPANSVPVILVEYWPARRLVQRIVELEWPQARVIAERELAGIDRAQLTFGPRISMTAGA